jgi:hypothetical protein
MDLIKKPVVNKFVQLANKKYIFRRIKNSGSMNLTFGRLIHPKYIAVLYEPDE